MPHVVIDSKKYHYSAVIPKHDIKNAIVFVHGAGGSHEHWSYQISHLGQNYLSIAVDLPGHGESEGCSYNNIDEYCDFIYDFAERVLGVKFFLAGHSMGGAIAMSFAVRYPDKLNGLILIGTGAKLKVAPAILDAFAAGNKYPDFVKFAYSNNASNEIISQARREMDNTDAQVYYNDFSACNNFDIMEQLHNIKTPVLILGASEDQLTPLKYSEYLLKNMSNSQMHIIEQAGHMIMLEKPDETNILIDNFISTKL